MFIEICSIFVSNKVMMEELEFGKGTINRFDDSVVLIEFDKNVTVENEDLKKQEGLVDMLLGHVPYYAISILPSDFKRFSMEPKDFNESNNLLRNRVADCYIVSSLTQRIELELSFQLYKPYRKTKIFSSINKALTWINSYKELEDSKKEVTMLV